MKKIEGIEEYYASRNIWRKAIYLNDLREIERMIGFEMVDLKGDFGKEMLDLAKEKGNPEIIRILEKAVTKE